MTPAMVCFDGFYLSHSMQRVDTPSDEEAWNFVKPYVRKNMYLDPKDVMFVNDLCPTVEHTEMKYQQMMGFENAARVTDEVFAAYEKEFGRKLQKIETYMLDDAEVAVVTIGSMSGTGKYVVNQLREKGIKAGLLRICMFRPFPAEEVAAALKNVKVVGVVDRSSGLGAAQGPVCSEVKAACYGSEAKIFSFVGGIAGRDISDGSFRKIFGELLDVAEGKADSCRKWFDVKDNAMNLREVEVPC